MPDFLLAILSLENVQDCGTARELSYCSENQAGSVGKNGLLWLVGGHLRVPIVPSDWEPEEHPWTAGSSLPSAHSTTQPMQLQQHDPMSQHIAALQLPHGAHPQYTMHAVIVTAVQQYIPPLSHTHHTFRTLLPMRSPTNYPSLHPQGRLCPLQPMLLSKVSVIHIFSTVLWHTSAALSEVLGWLLAEKHLGTV